VAPRLKIKDKEIEFGFKVMAKVLSEVDEIYD